MKTLAEEMREEADRLRRRFIHATRPRCPLSLEDAIKLARTETAQQQPEAADSNVNETATDG